MVIDFSLLDLTERPVLSLRDASGTRIGTLGYAKDVSVDIKYNEVSEISFSVPSQVERDCVMVDTPFYDSLVGMRIVELQDIGWFMLVNPVETNDGILRTKECKCYSLEYEFTFKNLTLDEGTYNFWNPATPDSTVLGLILSEMPSWKVGTVDKNLIGKYRTFSVSGENLYNFMKNTLQQSYSCIFDFDTINRKINVRDVSSEIPTNPVYLSNMNLAKEISVEEDTESIVTRLDVNGADGIDIRDVNPSGTNKLVNLDYFMNTGNFPQSLIDKYHAWQQAYLSQRTPYYNLSVEYSLQVMRRTTEEAAKTELQGELTALENQQAVIIQSIALGLDTQSSLDKKNAEIKAKQAEIDAKQRDIDAVAAQAKSLLTQMQDINKKTKFETYFTPDEYLMLDRFIKDDSVSESSFVADETESYDDSNVGQKLSNARFDIKGATVTKVTNSVGKDIYDVRGGSISCSFVSGEVIRAACEKAKDNACVMTAYLGNVKVSGVEYTNACLSMSGTASAVSSDAKADPQVPNTLVGTTLSLTVSSGYYYFTLNTGEYKKRAVAWDLLEYGDEVLRRLSQPSYTFSVSSANFLTIDEFVSFKNSLRHGEKIYVGISEDETLEPILIGAQFDFDNMDKLELEFSDKYVASDKSFKLADLLEQSVSMGKSVDVGKFEYSAFVNSGANTRVKEFMDSALDVAKNAIISSKEQAITWGDSGIRLRKWATEAHQSYAPEEVWLNNNSILMTSNNWATAEIAIGHFHDTNLGDCWGIVAPNIVGTLLAGNNLVIESQKKDGKTAVFKVDAEGCVLHNSFLSVTSGNLKSHILLDPDHGLMIGKYPLINDKGVVQDANKYFYADTEGNLYLKGHIDATSGTFHGRIEALEGYIGDSQNGWTISSTAIYNGRNAYSSDDKGIYIGTDGISLGDGNGHYVKAWRDSGTLSANNVDITGRITALSGYIGNNPNGWEIGTDSQGHAYLRSGRNDLNTASPSGGIYVGTDGFVLGQGGTADSWTLPYIAMYPNGQLWAVGANISGVINATTINASNGVIGGMSLANEGLYNGKPEFGSSAKGIFVGPNGINLGSSGSSDNWSGRYVSLQPNGEIWASAAHIGRGYIGQTWSEYQAGKPCWTIGEHSIYYAKPHVSDSTKGIYLGTDGIALGQAWNDNLPAGESNAAVVMYPDGRLYANIARFTNAYVSGTINATAGNIGGCIIKDNNLTIDSAHIGTLTANQIKGGTFDFGDGEDQIDYLSADDVGKGEFADARIPGLDSSKITSGTFGETRVSGIDAGYFGADEKGIWVSNEVLNWERRYCPEVFVVDTHGASGEQVRLFFMNGLLREYMKDPPNWGG